MRSLTPLVLLAGLAMWAGPLAAQQEHNCSGYSIIIGSPEDKLMLAVNGSDDPNEKVAALEDFSQKHSDSKYLPCVEEHLTRNYVKLKQYDKAIEAGKKAVAAGYLDVGFVEDLLQAYIATGNASEEAFDVIAKAAESIKAATMVPKKVGESDEEFDKAKKAASQQAKGDTDYMMYAFMNLLPRVSDPQQRIKALDQFTQAYPELTKERMGDLGYQYAVAYAQVNQLDKADEYGEKAIAADPNNTKAMNLVAYDYAFRVQAKRAQAAEYATKVVTLVPTLKKPAGFTDEQFKGQQDSQEGMAHLTLGYLDLVKNARSHHVSGAVKEFKQAAELLTSDPELQGQAYYLLGFSYETLYPAQHHLALRALEQAVKIQSSTQGKARELLAKVRRVAH